MKILVTTFAYNEEDRIKEVVRRTLKAQKKSKYKWDFYVIDDGTTDGSLNGLPNVIRNSENKGIGFRMQQACDMALKYDVMVIMAGNNKDAPEEIDTLLEPIMNGQVDFVQGSRFMPGALYGNMPWHRLLATKHIHPWLCGTVAGKKLTESSNGFRAFSTKILKDKKIDWKQEWLIKYQLEPYLLIKSIQCGYRHTEVPCTKIYPNKKTTKMQGLKSWWHMVQAPIYLGLGIKK